MNLDTGCLKKASFTELSTFRLDSPPAAYRQPVPENRLALFSRLYSNIWSHSRQFCLCFLKNIFNTKSIYALIIIKIGGCVAKFLHRQGLGTLDPAKSYLKMTKKQFLETGCPLLV